MSAPTHNMDKRHEQHQIKYECATCGAIFTATRANKRSVARCERCGSIRCKQVKVDALTAGHKVRQEGKALILEPRTAEMLEGHFACVDCAKKFSLTVRSSDTPTCPECHGTNMKALTPLATLINDRGRPIRDKQVIKFLRFIQHGWENLKKFERALDGVCQTADRLGVPDEARNRLREAAKEAVEALDQKHQTILEEYEKYKIEKKLKDHGHTDLEIQ